MTKKQSNLILIAVAIVVISLSLFAYFNQKNKDKNVTPQIVEELITPYAKALSNKNYEQAYKDYTTESFKNEYSYDEYLESQKENVAEYGIVEKIEPMTGIFLTQKRMYQSWHFIGTLRYVGSKKQERIQVEVVKSDSGKFLINNTYYSFLQYDARSNEPKIF
jgi:hypothetical protein